VGFCSARKVSPSVLPGIEEMLDSNRASVEPQYEELLGSENNYWRVRGNRRSQAFTGGSPKRWSQQRNNRSTFAIPSCEEENHRVKVRWGEDAWQYKALHFINSTPVQRLLIALLLLDVLILFAELAIDVHVPSCKVIVRDAISCCPLDGDVTNFYQGGGGGYGESVCAEPLLATDHTAGCDPHKHHGAHVTHECLFWITISILSLFQAELLFLIYLLGMHFFKVPLYVFDLVIVTISLVLELVFHFYLYPEVTDTLPGILIIVRCWRFVRIGHGLVVSTYEVGEHAQMEIIFSSVEHIRKLEAIIRDGKFTKELPEWPEILQEEFKDAEKCHVLHS